jgi:hypothetical protein
VVGRISTCVYDLRRRSPTDTWYRGISTDSERLQLDLRIPPTLDRHPPHERGAFVALFLMSLCSRPTTVRLAGNLASR